MIRRIAVAAALSAALPAGGASRLDFHPGENLQELALHQNGGAVAATWLRGGLAVIDPASLEIADLETASFLIPMQETAGAFFYAYYPTPSSDGEIRSLRGRETKFVAAEPDSGFSPLGAKRMVFTTRQPGQDVWISDGSAAGTRFLADVAPGWNPCPFPCDPQYNEPTRVQAAPNGRIFFLADGGDFGSPSFNYWTIDPPFTRAPAAQAPARRIFHALGYPPQISASLPTADGRLLYFNHLPASVELLSSDGGAPIRVAEIPRSGSYPHIAGLRRAAEGFVFLAEWPGRRQLWRTDGFAGAAPIHDFGPGPAIPEGKVWQHSAAGRVYFAASAGGAGEELWSTDGSAAGTGLPLDARPGSAGSSPASFRELPGGAFLVALDDGAHGREPWISDGTAAGTRLLADAEPGPAGSNPTHLLAVAGRLFFVGDGPLRREIFYLEID